MSRVPETTDHRNGLLQRATRALPLYWLFTYLLALAQVLLALLPLTPGSDQPWAYIALLLCSAPAAYVLPLAGVVHLTRYLPNRLSAWLAPLLAWLGAACLQVLLLVDRIIHELFAFHINGFVWNLVTTPGGIESMGGGADTTASFVSMALAWFVAQATAMYLAAVCWARLPHSAGLPLHTSTNSRPWPRMRVWLPLLLLSILSERVWHAWASLQGNQPVLAAAERTAFHVPVTMRGLAVRLGIPIQRNMHLSSTGAASTLAYPRRPLRFAPTTTPTALPHTLTAGGTARGATVHQAARAEQLVRGQPPNIVILVSESLRADMLTSTIMPNTWAMAQRGVRFTQHYSGGNGTRVGMFTLFYGLYGNNWKRFLAAQRAPVLMQRISALGYQISLQTSARFSYPEFDRTLFAEVPDADMHEDSDGQGWERDRRNVARFISWLQRRDRNRPFMFFQFFESPHAKYDFPADAVIARPYLPALNYASMDVHRDMPLVRNRYINAVHHLDQQLGRVFAALEREQLLDSTIVLVTGDHGEEFMEKGNWGHNSFFTEEQTRVPMVLLLPGQPAAVIDRMTSHLDVAPTLMRLLGVQNPVSDFAHGVDLLNGPARHTMVFADWNHIGVLLDGYKFSVATEGGTYTARPVTTRSDATVANADDVMRSYEAQLWRVLRDANGFVRTQPAAQLRALTP